MSDLKTIDFRLLDRAFAMDGGYVLDFSNRTMSEFFADELNVDIDDQRWSADGTSKGRRLKFFLRSVDNSTAAKTLVALWEYAKVYSTPAAEVEGPLLTLIARLRGQQSPPSTPKPEMASIAPKVALLRDNLMKLWSLPPQARGLAFEKFLTDAFTLYGMKSRERFRVRGEEIDGSFDLAGVSYLLEAKWTVNPIGAADLHVFEGKMSQRAQWARGLFVSYTGFSEDGLLAFGRGKRTVCMNGQDFDELLLRQLPVDIVISAKARAAVETGSPFVAVRDLRL
ncbi:MAG: restriction endonuclease [Sphingomonas sp.]